MICQGRSRGTSLTGFNTSSVIESLPVFSAARAMPDRPTLIFSAYCSGMRDDFQPPACVIAARSISRAAKSWVAPNAGSSGH